MANFNDMQMTVIDEKLHLLVGKICTSSMELRRQSHVTLALKKRIIATSEK